jgi:hypothetical protein
MGREGIVPDSYGKRNREKVKARKAEERDERRIARSKRRKGILPTTPSPEVEPPDVVTIDTEA